ncbi:unnamed protein product, partial [Effrenium voratum]
MCDRTAKGDSWLPKQAFSKVSPIVGYCSGVPTLPALTFPKDQELDIGAFKQTLRFLSVIAQSAAVDTEFVVHSSDVPQVERPGRRRLGGCGGRRCIFSTSSGPRFCDIAMGPGLRPFIKSPTEPGVTDVPYRSKQNLGFWRGAVWPARRCGDWRRSPRVLMCQASQKHPDVLNASLGSLQCGPKEPSELCELIRTWRPHRVNFSEQFQYRFLLTSTPKCTYTGRMTPFLSSTSVVAMFSNGEEAVGQVLHGAFEEDVHFKYVHAGRFVEELRQMQRDWEPLEALSVNARKRWAWATDRDTLHCYLYGLMTRYAQKLDYVPSVNGTIQALLRGSVPAEGQPWHPGAELRAAGDFLLESWPLPKA